MIRVARFVAIVSSVVSWGFPSLLPAQQQSPVPGTGTWIEYVGDVLEDPAWEFVHNHPKSSYENDDLRRFPGGFSVNRRWEEGGERGQPDLLKVVPTPADGLPGSQYALLLQTLHSGVPGRSNGRVEQDDLVVNGVNRIGTIPVTETPSVVVRVYLPPADTWEDRTGPHFGFRTQVTTKVRKTDSQPGRFRSRSHTYTAVEPYWPGIWVHFFSGTDGNVESDAAALTVRGNRLGHDFRVRDITSAEFGWWTLGMSFSPDGAVHYFASPGVDDLTADDYLTTQFPYSYRAIQMENMFFNVCNRNDGRTWSTPFVIDDPRVYVLRADRVQSIVQRRQAAAQTATKSGSTSRTR